MNIRYNWDNWIKLARYNPNDILSKVTRRQKPINLHGKMVNLKGLKLNCFKKIGTECVNCGLEGTEIHLELDPNANQDREKKWFLNLYGFKNGWPMLMTIDHIIPVSKGGKRETLKNVQPMCWECNTKKGDQLNV